jgi:hypothetical protein
MDSIPGSGKKIFLRHYFSFSCGVHKIFRSINSLLCLRGCSDECVNLSRPRIYETLFPVFDSLEGIHLCYYIVTLHWIISVHQNGTIFRKLYLFILKSVPNTGYIFIYTFILIRNQCSRWKKLYHFLCSELSSHNVCKGEKMWKE